VDARETLLSNADGSIVAEGPLVLVCDCPGGLADSLVLLYAPVALTASIVVSTLVGLRAAPLPLLAIAVIWTAGAAVGHGLAKRVNRKHGRFRIDLERGSIVQRGKGFSRTFDARKLVRVSTPVVSGAGDVEEGPNDAALAPRWLLLEMEGGEELRIGKGPSYSLRPALVFFREAGAPVSDGPG